MRERERGRQGVGGETERHISEERENRGRQLEYRREGGRVRQKRGSYRVREER